MFASSDLVEWWRGAGPVLWMAAAGATVLWALVLAWLWVRTEPRRVSVGPATLEPGGSEPPAVVSLLTSDWELSHTAVPATLLDLASRRHVSIDSIGERTLVRVRMADADTGGLTGYERMVLEHVAALARATADGFVPADALTTGPEAVSQNWWRRFRDSVVDDARGRGLSRPRWGGRERAILGALAAVVGVAVGVAATTLTAANSSSTGSGGDDNPILVAVGMGLMAAAVLAGAAGRLGGERDTPAGRDAASRWLGLRAMLANDPLFASQPPAAVAIWDRLLAYGAALGMARSAVAELPLGAESEHHAWSPVGNRWRLVRIRYPLRLPPGYGRPPVLVALVGLLMTVVGVLVAPGALSVAGALLRAAGDAAGDQTAPAWLRAAVGLALGAAVAGGGAVALVGVALLGGGVGDLLRPRRAIEGRVLRVRERTRGDDRRRVWHVAVDDGGSDHIQAWRLACDPGVEPGATVRAQVSPWLRHVPDLTVVGEREPAALPSATSAPGVGGEVDVGVDAPSMPEAAAVSAALGFSVALAPSASAYPLALRGASSTFVAPDGGRVLAAWLRPAEIERFRDQVGAVVARVDGVGDEVYRATMGGGLVARAGHHVLLVEAALPALTDAQRNRAVDAVARSAVAAARTA